MNPSHRTPAKYSLRDIAIIISFAFSLCLVLFPILMQGRGSHDASGCPSRMKQIALSMLQYGQDYDEEFPIAFDGKAIWGTAVVGRYYIIEAYTKSADIFVCPEVERNKEQEHELTYMYNDLTAGKPRGEFTRPAHTVLLAESDPMAANVGHARSAPGAEATQAIFNSVGACDGGRGAAVSEGAFRHDTGGNFVMADGHVKWFKPERIFFPSRQTDQDAHQQKGGPAVGPDPDGSMTFGGIAYAGTFHIR